MSLTEISARSMRHGIAVGVEVRIVDWTAHAVASSLRSTLLFAMSSTAWMSRRALDRLDSFVKFGLGVAGLDRHGLLHDHGAGVDALVDDVHGDSGLRDSRGQRIAHGVGAGEGGKQGGMRVDQLRRQGRDDARRQDAHESGAAPRGRAFQHLDLLEQLVAPGRPRLERGRRHREGGDSELLGVGEACSVVVCPDGHDPGRKLGVGLRRRGGRGGWILRRR